MQGLQNAQKHLRLDPTTPEARLWSVLRDRRCGGLKFRRQVPIGRYIVDFFCLDLGLVIEVDGDEHVYRIKSDEKRTAFLKSLGYHVVRFGNDDIMKNIDGTTEHLLTVAADIKYKNDR